MYGKVVEHEIIRDHMTKRSRGFGFIVFDNEQVDGNLLTDGNMIDMAGAQVKIKKAEPKKPSNPPPAPAYGSDSRGRAHGDSYGGFGGSSFGPASYRSMGSGFGGTVAELYVEMKFGVEKVLGTRDWKNSLIGGALIGAIVSTVSGHDKDKIIMNAITGGAVATAAEFLNYLT